MRDSGWIQLHVAEFLLVWQALGLGEPPAALEIPHGGRTAVKRAELVEAADAALAARDLGTVARPAEDLASLLRILAESELALDLSLASAGEPFRAVSAARRQEAATVGVEGTVVRVGGVRRTEMIESLLDTVEGLPAGPGSPANVRAEDYANACAAGEREGVSGFVDVLRSAALRPTEFNTLARAVTGRRGGGRFAGSARTRYRGRTRTAVTISWVDTAEGRYAFRRSGEWLTVTPADPARLRAIAHDLVAPLESSGDRCR